MKKVYLGFFNGYVIILILIILNGNKNVNIVLVERGRDRVQNL